MKLINRRPLYLFIQIFVSVFSITVTGLVLALLIGYSLQNISRQLLRISMIHSLFMGLGFAVTLIILRKLLERLHGLLIVVISFSMTIGISMVGFLTAWITEPLFFLYDRNMAFLYVTINLLFVLSVSLLLTLYMINEKRSSKQEKILQKERALGKQLVALTEELKEKNEFKSKYLANMSHEIRTPLNAIIGNNQQILLGGFDSYDDILDILNDIIDILKTGENDIDTEQYRGIKSICDEYKRLIFDTGRELKEHFYLRLNEMISIDSDSDKTVIDQLQSLIGEIGTCLANEQENTRQALQTSNNSGQYLLDLINSILDIAKIEAGKITVEPKEVDLNEFMNDIYNNADAYRKAKDKTDRVNLIKNMGNLVTDKATFDPGQIKQVLLNLMSNAIKFTKDGNIEMSVDKVEGNLLFCVKDSGLGIKKDEMERLFTEFGRTSSTQNIEGTGLGLALSKKLIELQGGRIEVESKFGSGSLFRVVLPV